MIRELVKQAILRKSKVIDNKDLSTVEEINRIGVTNQGCGGVQVIAAPGRIYSFLRNWPSNTGSCCDHIWPGDHISLPVRPEAMRPPWPHLAK